MKTINILLFIIVFQFASTICAKAEIYRIDGYVLSQTNYYPVEDEIVEVKNETGITIAWFQTNQNGLYSGTFELDANTNAFIMVEVSKMCDGGIHVFSNTITLNSPNLISNFFVCDFRSCRASFNFTQIEGNELIFQFEDISFGNITSWFWDFGDQQSSTLQHPVHQYQSPGHYTVSLHITTESCDDHQHRDVFVSETNCLALFSYEQQNDADTLWVQFENESTGNYSQLDWDFGDQSGSGQPSPRHHYNRPGNYPVKLRIWGQNCNHEIRKVISLAPASTCYALFTAQQNLTNDFEVQFTDISIGLAENRHWTFGDGQISDEQNPMHLYNEPGNYEVSLTISGSKGTSTFTRTVEVTQNHFCQAAFSFYKEYPESPSVSFTNQSSGSNFTSVWSFGDGANSPEMNPSHTYGSAGNYEVKLILTDITGCTDTASETISILPPLNISGTVMAGSSLISYGDIYLFKETSADAWQLTSKIPMGDGNFSFSGILPGNYLMMAVPVFDFGFPQIPKYLPTYFNGVSHWHNAQQLSTESLPETITIQLLSHNNFFDGEASITGKVNHYQSATTLPLILYLCAESGELLDFTFTDAGGNFIFDEIPFGNYKLYPEMAGKQGEALAVEVSATTPSAQNIVFTEEEFRIYPDLTAISETNSKSFSVAPNPSSEFVSVMLNELFSVRKNSSLSLLSIDGKALHTVLVNSSEIKLDLRELKAGIYFLRYTTDNNMYYSKLIVTH